MRRYKVIDTDCEADVWFDNVENKLLDYKDIEKILEKQCSQWQKLKEWLNKEADDVRYTPYDCKSLSDDFELWHLNKILEKMQELEGEDE